MVECLILDTSPIIAHLRGKVDLTETISADALLYTSIFTVGELRKGMYKLNDPSREQAKIDSLFKTIAILMPNENTADFYAQVAADLEQRGQKIPENDIWIAATALEHSMKLVHGDRHFARVPNLIQSQLFW